jgi:endoglucanase
MRPGLRQIAALVLSLVMGLFGLAYSQAPATVDTGFAKRPLVVHVDGNHLVDRNGAVVQLAGLNRSGSEYACAQGWGIFDGPVDDQSIEAMTTWRPQIVRVPLNEDCWLGINGVDPEYGGDAYRQAIKGFVGRLEAHGLLVDLELHLSAPGDELALEQQVMADADHSPAFWRSVAKTFKGDHAVLFELFNEPHDISWGCWLHGCRTDEGWRTAGMQQLLDAVRSTGATNVVLVGGLVWSSDLSKWLANKPVDPTGQLAAAFHTYDFSGCNTQSCWDSTVAKVAKRVPVVMTEFGETDCAGGYVGPLMDWADAHGVSYLAWTWDVWPCTSGPALITSYDGTPTGYGDAVRSHYLER